MNTIEAVKRSFHLNKALRILLFTNSLILVAGATIGPIYALYVEKIGGDLLDASFAGAAFAFSAGITVFVVGKYVDKLKQPEMVMVWGYALIGLGYLLYTFVNSIWFLLAIQLLIGFGEAIYNPPFDALYSRHIEKKHAGKEWGIWESANYFSIAIGAVIGGFIVTNFGFSTLFLLMAFLCFGSVLYILFLPKHTL